MRVLRVRFVRSIDAVIFDILRVIINKRFFEFIRYNDFKESYKLNEIAEFNSYDLFQDDVVSKMLKDNYARGLLERVYRFDNSYFIINESDVSKDIYEILARRNIHLHKRWIVDEVYFSQSLGNKFCLKNGDYSAIGYGYFLYAYNNLVGFINNFNCI